MRNVSSVDQDLLHKFRRRLIGGLSKGETPDAMFALAASWGIPLATVKEDGRVLCRARILELCLRTCQDQGGRIVAPPPPSTPDLGLQALLHELHASGMSVTETQKRLEELRKNNLDLFAIMDELGSESGQQPVSK